MEDIDKSSATTLIFRTKENTSDHTTMIQKSVEENESQSSETAEGKQKQSIWQTFGHGRSYIRG